MYTVQTSPVELTGVIVNGTEGFHGNTCRAGASRILIINLLQHQAPSSILHDADQYRLF